MNIDDLLVNNKTCKCGKQHKVGIEKTIIESGAIRRMDELTKEYHHILLVSDCNTYNACGRYVESIIKNRIEHNRIFVCDGFLVPDEHAIEDLQSQITSQTDLIIGIGSGVINDLCKHVSCISNLPYYIVATAPSMDGYASTGAAMIIRNMKVTFNAHVPKAIIADTNVLKKAPIEMIKAGYGDIIGKFSALNDWKLSHLVMNEYFCDDVHDLVYKTVMKTVSLAEGLLERNEESIKTLMEALVIVGIAMSYVGNSRPASGSEHHLSHFFEVVGLLNNEPYFLHGIDVAYSTVATQKIREKLTSLHTPLEFRKFDRNTWEKEIRKIYSQGADGVIVLQDKLGWYEQDLSGVYTNKWEEIKKVLSEVPDSRTLMNLLNRVELPYEDFLNEYKEEKMMQSLLYAKDLKDRYTVLWPFYSILS